jgi:NAD(P)-dependent dehydrogenase (short-subunit alcohol dehydrogenase family)
LEMNDGRTLEGKTVLITGANRGIGEALVALLIDVVQVLRALVRLPVTIVRWLVERCRASWRYLRERDSRRLAREAAVSRREASVRRRFPGTASMFVQTVAARVRRVLVAVARDAVLVCSLVIAAVVYLPRWLVLVPSGILVLRRRRRAYARSRASCSRQDRSGVFLSYRSAQHQAADAVRRALAAHGFAVWLDFDRQ